MTAEALDELTHLLERRLEVIADHEFRDRDSAAHLEELKKVSEAIMVLHQQAGELPPRLNHFLTQCSYQKALDWIREQQGA